MLTALCDWLWLGVCSCVALPEAVETWLGVKLGVTLGVGVSVSTTEIVRDGVAVPVKLRVCEALGVET